MPPPGAAITGMLGGRVACAANATAWQQRPQCTNDQEGGGVGVQQQVPQSQLTLRLRLHI
jgi:hypothetical protein